jgi:hypothetical protein
VHDATAALSFYRDQLGFEITFQGPADDVFFGIVQRGLVATALAEKMSALLSRENLEQRASRGSRRSFDSVMPKCEPAMSVLRAVMSSEVSLLAAGLQP